MPSMGPATTPTQARIMVSGNFVTAQPLVDDGITLSLQRPGASHRCGGITRQLDHQHGLLISCIGCRSPASFQPELEEVVSAGWR